MTTDLLLGYTPRGNPVCDRMPDEPLLWSLLLHRLPRPDEAEIAPTALSLPVAVQEEAPTAEAVGAGGVGRRPIHSIP